MADRKISDLTALTTPASGDYLPIVDISEAAAVSKNKRITIEELFRGVPSGTAAAPSIAIEGDEDTGVYSPGANQLAISTGGTGRLFVDASGNVGISAAPDVRFAFGDFTSNEAIRFRQAVNGYGTIYFANGSSGANLYQGFIEYGAGTAGDFMRFGTAQNERLRITSAGFVGIGTTSPQNRFVVSNSGAEGIEFIPGYTSNRNVTIHYNRSGATYVQNDQIASAHVFRIASDSTQAAIIDSSGRLGVGTSSPSYLLDLDGTTSAAVLQLNSNNATFGVSANFKYNGSAIGGIGSAKGIDSTLALTDLGINGVANIDLCTGYTKRVRIDSSGRVGIGTSSPATLLHLSNTSQIRHTCTSTANAISFWKDGTPSFAAEIGCGSATGFASALKFDIYNGSSWNTAVNIDSSSRVGIGTTSPSAKLHVFGTGSSSNTLPANASAVFETDGNAVLAVSVPSASAGGVVFPRGTDAYYAGIERAGTDLNLRNNGSTRATIDSSGRLLVGTSTARANFFNSAVSAGVQAESTGEGAIVAAIRNNSSTGVPVFLLARSKGDFIGSNTAVASGDELGYISFQGSDGTQFVEGARISAAVDAASGADDLPSRLVFSTTADGASSPTERMRISQNGKTQMFANANDNVLMMRSAEGAGTTTYIFAGVYSATGIGDGTVSFGVFTNGNAVNTNNSYGALSDIKLKENIVDANSQWSDIKALQVRKYNFKEETGQQTHTQIGLVAQEVELVSPGLVTESPDRDAEGNDLGTVTKSVNYSVLYMKAVKALQEAMERIETLEAKVAALEAN